MPVPNKFQNKQSLCILKHAKCNLQFKDQIWKIHWPEKKLKMWLIIETELYINIKTKKTFKSALTCLKYVWFTDHLNNKENEGRRMLKTLSSHLSAQIIFSQNYSSFPLLFKSYTFFTDQTIINQVINSKKLHHSLIPNFIFYIKGTSWLIFSMLIIMPDSQQIVWFNFYSNTIPHTRHSGAWGQGGCQLPPPPRFFVNVPLFSKSPRSAPFERSNQKYTWKLIFYSHYYL